MQLVFHRAAQLHPLRVFRPSRAVRAVVWWNITFKSQSLSLALFLSLLGPFVAVILPPNVHRRAAGVGARARYTHL
jgi:hypothetical protein